MATVKRRIVRRDYKNSGKAEQELKVDDNELMLDRLIYRRIGSLTDNKTLFTPADNDTEFNRWLLDMNNLHNKKNYPLLAADLPEPTPDLIALDEYLGMLGVEEEYPFDSDTYYVESWIEGGVVSPERAIMDMSDNTYLTDSNGTEVLIYISGV